ncbi:hypothetical protein CKJ89_38755, partial [Klebsiella pneumoniae]
TDQSGQDKYTTEVVVTWAAPCRCWAASGRRRTGQLRTRKWTDQSGQDKYTTEVVVTWAAPCRCWAASGRRRTG